MRTFTVALLLAAATVQAQPRIVADINTIGSSDPDDAVAYDGKLYFAATNRNVGRELWAYDPETGETTLAADLLPGQNFAFGYGGHPHDLTVYGDELVFGVVGETAYELWSYSASTGLTRSLARLKPSWITELAGKLYFAAYGPGVGHELWVYDGETETVEVAADIQSGAGSSDPSDLLALGGKLYFKANDVLQVYDPATGLAQSAANEPLASSPQWLTVLDGDLYFVAGDQRDLWRYAPSTSEMSRVVNGSTTSTFAHLVAYEGLLYYGSDRTAYDPSSGQVVSVSGGGGMGTPTVYGGKLVYRTFDDTTQRTHLSIYDAETGVASVIESVPPGSVSSEYPSSAGTWEATVLGDRVYFAAGELIDGERLSRELWVYDDATGEAGLAAEVESADGSGPYGLVAHGGRLFFGAYVGPGAALWSYDPSTESARREAVAELGPRSTPTDLTPHDGTLYFSASDTDHGRELWSLSSTTGEAGLVADIEAGEGSGTFFPGSLASYAGRLYLNASDQGFDHELWAYDAATDQVERVADIRPGADGSWPEELTVVGDRLYFRADDGSTGSELWVYDATSGATKQVADLRPGAGGSVPRWLTPYAGDLYVFASDGTPTSKRKLWIVETDDDTPRSVDLGVEIDERGLREEMSGFVVYNERLYFPARDANEQRPALWVYDASTGVAEAVTAFEAREPNSWAVYAGRLYLSAWTLEFGHELWAYDDQADEATLIGDLLEGADGSGPSELTVLDGRLYFTAFDRFRGGELWSYDAQGDVAAAATPVGVSRLSAPAPNPTRGRTEITVRGQPGGRAVVTLHDVLGRELSRLLDEPVPPGEERVLSVDARGLAPGLYVVRAASSDGQAVRTFTVVR